METYSNKKKFAELCKRAEKLGYEENQSRKLAIQYILYFYKVPTNGEILLFEDWCKNQ